VFSLLALAHYKYHKDKTSNDENLIFEAKHEVSFLDYITLSFFTFFGLSFLLALFIPPFEIKGLLFGICMVVVSLILPFFHLLYWRKQRVYITTEGIGMDFRRYGRLHKRFFHFGEVGLSRFSIGYVRIPLSDPDKFIIHPLGAYTHTKFGGTLFKIPFKKRICAATLTSMPYFSPKVYDSLYEKSCLKEYVVRKTKEALRQKRGESFLASLPYEIEEQFFAI
jgi:hypothetical protein